MDIFLAIIGLGLLVLGAEIVIRGSISFGKKINISLFAIGVVIVAGGTSLPELASSINAVLNNYSDLALGAVVGSNIANLVLVMAATTIIFPIVNITTVSGLLHLCRNETAGPIWREMSDSASRPNS